MEENIGCEKKIFTIILDQNWNTSKDLFSKEYRIVSEFRKHENGNFEVDIEEVI